MSWICPACKREFKNTNQAHSCVTRDVSEHLAHTSPDAQKAFDKLMRGVRRFGPVSVSSVKHVILLKAGTTFLAIKPKKDRIDIEFLLEKEIVDFRIIKTVRASKRRIAHFSVLEHPRDVNAQLLRWLKQSYILIRDEANKQ